MTAIDAETEISRLLIIMSGLFSRSIESLQLRTLSDITLDEKGDGTGTISFGPSHPMMQWFAGAAWPGMGSYSAPAFEMIPAARDVFTQIREAQKEA